MAKLDKKDIDEFIQLAETKNIRISKGALIGIEDYLDKDYWQYECESKIEFYLHFKNIVESIADYLLVNYDANRPEIMAFLNENEHELSKQFPRIKTKGATYAHMSITMRYILAQVLLRVLSKNNDFRENESLTPKVLQALWASYKTDEYASPEEKEQWQAYSILLKLIYGKYNDVIQEYEKTFKYDLAKYENSRRTLIKECYMLSKIAIGDYDDDLLFGANPYISLLKYQFYLWRVNEDLTAEIELVPLLVIVYFHRVIVDKSMEDQFEIFPSMQPKTVLDELQQYEVN